MSAPLAGGRWLPGPVETSMGIGIFRSTSPGIGGRIKTAPADFQVDEVSRYPMPDPKGRFTIVRVCANDVEQNALVTRLQRALGLPPGAIGFAGTKDRRAISTQLLSLPVAPERLDGLHLSGVEVLERYRSGEGLNLGHLYGNRFRIRLEGVPGDDRGEVRERALAVERELRAGGGFPNFFGPQRFGEIRPVTHLVGRALVLHSADQAVHAYLTAGVEEQVPEGHEARAAYASHRDPARALREFPDTFNFERTLLDKLAQGKGAEAALRALPRTLRQLFVHAYQSYLFNRLLTRRTLEGLPLNDPVPGDRVIRVGVDGLESGGATVPVTSDNLSEIRAWVRSGRARVAGPLVGTETPDDPGRPGELLHEIMEEEGVERKDFHIPEAPELSSRGTHRSLLAPLPLRVFPDPGPDPGAPSSPAEEGLSLAFDFLLEKGQYATVLLREFTKAQASWAVPAPGNTSPPLSS
jgi:tRNA pseudouridine13 synthase